MNMNWKNIVFIIINLINIINIFLVVFNILPRETWWGTLFVVIVVGLMSMIYFIDLFGTYKGVILSCVIVFSSFLVFCNAKMLPFIQSNDRYAYALYFTLSCCWLTSIAISHSFTYSMPFLIRTVFSFVIVFYLFFFLIPILALFTRFHDGNTEYFHFQTTVSGYLIIIGFFIIYYFLLLLAEVAWLVNYKKEWQHRMIAIFMILSGIVIIVGFKVGFWQTSIVAFLIMISLIVVAKSKVRGEYKI